MAIVQCKTPGHTKTETCVLLEMPEAAGASLMLSCRQALRYFSLPSPASSTARSPVSRRISWYSVSCCSLGQGQGNKQERENRKEPKQEHK